MLKELDPRGAAAASGRLPCQGCAPASGFAPEAACPLRLPVPAGVSPAQGDAGCASPAEPVGATQLRIRVLRRKEYLLVRLEGEVDLATACALHFALRAAVRDVPRLAVDVAGLAFIDVLGVRMLRRARDEAVRDGGWLRLLGVRPQLGSLIELLGVTRSLPAHRDEAAMNLSVLPRG